MVKWDTGKDFVYSEHYIFVICRTPGKLRKFVQDLHSGKLHREFHHGPDPEQEQEQVVGSLFTICLNLHSFLVYHYPIEV